MIMKRYKKMRAFGLAEVLVGLSIFMVGILPIFMLYSQNSQDLSKQKEKMVTLYIAKRIMETIRQFNANSPDNYDVLETTFNFTDKKVVDNFSPGDFFFYFEDLKTPYGFADEVGIDQTRYPNLYDFLKYYRYSVKVQNYEHTYHYDNYYGRGTTSVTLKEVIVTVTDPHKQKFEYRCLLSRARR